MSIHFTVVLRLKSIDASIQLCTILAETFRTAVSGILTCFLHSNARMRTRYNAYYLTFLVSKLKLL